MIACKLRVGKGLQAVRGNASAAGNEQRNLETACTCWSNTRTATKSDTWRGLHRAWHQINTPGMLKEHANILLMQDSIIHFVKIAGVVWHGA